MEKKEYKLIGKIKSAQGLKGEVYALFFSKDYSYIDDIESFFIHSSPNNFIEMSVEFIKPHKEGLRLKFENINDRNSSEKLAGSELYLREDFFISEEGESLYLTEIEGFTLIDLTTGFEGIICGFSYNGAQDLLQVRPITPSENLKKEELKSEVFKAEKIKSDLLQNKQKHNDSAPAEASVSSKSKNMIYDIPFVEAFIKNIDYENKKVVSELPEGLLEINLTDKKSESV